MSTMEELKAELEAERQRNVEACMREVSAALEPILKARNCAIVGRAYLSDDGRTLATWGIVSLETK